MIHITTEARKFISRLLTRQKPGTQIKITIVKPNTLSEECTLAYLTPDQVGKSDVAIRFEEFSLYMDRKNLPFLEGARIDLVSVGLESHLVVETTQIETSGTANDDDLVKRIGQLIESRINTRLSLHRGLVRCTGVTRNMFALIEFGGSCRGCPASALTLREIVRKELLGEFPELSGVLDATEYCDES